MSDLIDAIKENNRYKVYCALEEPGFFKKRPDFSAVMNGIVLAASSPNVSLDVIETLCFYEPVKFRLHSTMGSSTGVMMDALKAALTHRRNDTHIIDFFKNKILHSYGFDESIKKGMLKDLLKDPDLDILFFARFLDIVQSTKKHQLYIDLAFSYLVSSAITFEKIDSKLNALIHNFLAANLGPNFDFSEEIMCVLLKPGCDLESIIKNKCINETQLNMLLCYASGFSTLEKFIYLLKKVIKYTESRDKYGRNLMEAALAGDLCSKNQFDIIKHLIEIERYPLNGRDKYNKTIFDHARIRFDYLSKKLEKEEVEGMSCAGFQELNKRLYPEGVLESDYEVHERFKKYSLELKDRKNQLRILQDYLKPLEGKMLADEARAAQLREQQEREAKEALRKQQLAEQKRQEDLRAQEQAKKEAERKRQLEQEKRQAMQRQQEAEKRQVEEQKKCEAELAKKREEERRIAEERAAKEQEEREEKEYKQLFKEFMKQQKASSANNNSSASHHHGAVNNLAQDFNGLSVNNNNITSSNEINFNQLQIIKRIGGGASGDVYLAKFSGADVAVKKFNANPSDIAPDSFKKEVAILTGLKNPNIVTLYNICTNPYCLVMEYAVNGSLRDVLVKQALPIITRLNFAYQITNALLYLHSLKPMILHRDIKSMNFLVDANWNVKITDFGLSQIRHSSSSYQTSSTNMNVTIAWMAPEKVMDPSSNYTPECDRYSLGVVFWEIASNKKLPYENRSLPEIMVSIMRGIHDPIPEDCPTEFKDLMLGLWNMNPQQRPQLNTVAATLERLCTQNNTQSQAAYMSPT